MGLTTDLFPLHVLLITGVLFAVGVIAALRNIDWTRLRQKESLQHTALGAAVALGCLWQLRAGLSPGLTIHFFGMTVVTLLVGWGLAVVAGLLALLMVVVAGEEPVSLFALNGLITVIIPALVSHAVMLWERRCNFRNFFAYIFFCAFFGAGLAVAAGGCVMIALLWFTGTYTWAQLVHEYLIYLPLIMLPEGFINGTVTTGFMVFHPERLETLDENRYR